MHFFEQMKSVNASAPVVEPPAIQEPAEVPATAVTQPVEEQAQSASLMSSLSVEDDSVRSRTRSITEQLEVGTMMDRYS